jgi:hypothetical protein
VGVALVPLVPQTGNSAARAAHAALSASPHVLPLVLAVVVGGLHE